MADEILSHDENKEKVVGGISILNGEIREIHTDDEGRLIIGSGGAFASDRVDAFGQTANVSWFHEVAVGFHKSLAANQVIETVSGGANSSRTDGQLTITVPDGGTYTAFTARSVPYRSGHETRAMATALFETAPAAGVTALLWLRSPDGTSGMAIGHDNGNYIVRRRFNSVDTDIVRSAWNHDDPITRQGTVEPVDFTKPQILRLRFGWLGWAGLIFEARNYDPDIDPWVLLHEYHFTQESGSDASLSNPEVQIGFEVNNSSGGADAVVRTNSWTLGPVLGFLGQIQPDGDIVFEKASGMARDVDGVDVETETPLGASGSYESGWVDSDGWGSIEFFMAADQVSATDGIEIEFTDDAQAATPTVRSTRTFTFSTASVALGTFVARFPTELDGFRIRYTNGGTPQGSFYLSATLRADTENPQSGLAQSVSGTALSVMTRSAVLAPNDNDVWDNVRRSLGDDSFGGPFPGLRVSMAEHETDTPIRPLTNFQTNQSNVGTTAVQIVGSPLTGRKTVAIKALGTNNARIYVGKSGVTTGSGWPLDSGTSVIMEIDDSAPGIFAISASGTQRAAWMEVA